MGTILGTSASLMSEIRELESSSRANVNAIILPEGEIKERYSRHKQNQQLRENDFLLTKRKPHSPEAVVSELGMDLHMPLFAKKF